MFERGVRQLITALATGLLLATAGCGGSGGDAGGSAEPPAAATSQPRAASGGAGAASGDNDEGRAVISETLPYAEVDEELVYGYFVFPADMVEPLPAVIVIHEWWGLDDGLRAMADRIAAQGYIVLAVDLFAGGTATTPAGGRDLMLRVVENPEPAEENLRQALGFLGDTAGAPRIASLGWGFGGGWSLNAALLFPEQLDAAVIYYGTVTDDDERLQPLSVPVLGIFAENDRGVLEETVREFESALERLRKDYDIRVFDGVGHAFANPASGTYAEDAAREAWGLTTAFLAEHLGGGNGNGGD